MKNFVPPGWLSLAVLGIALLVPLVAPAAGPVDVVASPAAAASMDGLPAGEIPVGELVGGADGFFCALGLGMMIGGTATFQPEIVLAGSIIMGLGCGTGN